MITLPESEHFRLEELADGVFAAVAKPGGAAGSNAGIIDLGHICLVFDTFEHPSAALDLRAAAEQVTGKPVRVVINSHAHLDHWMGNQVFEGEASIISTVKTAEWMPALAQEIENLKKDPSDLEKKLAELKAQIEQEPNERVRKAMIDNYQRGQYDLQDLPNLKLCLPDQLFEGRMFFRGPKRSVELVAVGPGHTAGDCYLALQDECIIFMGDLAFFGRQPYMRNSDPEQWLDRLEELDEACFNVFVPGHGSVGTHKEIELEAAYIRMITGLVRQAVQDNISLSALLQQPLPEPFDALSVTGLPHETSLRYLYERALEEHE